MCKASEYNEIVRFLLNEIINLGANVSIFDKSLIEYNDSLDYTYRRYCANKGVSFYSINDSPWIWKEYQKNPSAYNNNFAYCIATHKLPKDQDEDFISNASNELSKQNISLIKFENYRSKEELGKLYNTIYYLKLHHQNFASPKEELAFAQKVLHDANCISELQCSGSNPFITRKVFITCDKYLAQIRNKFPNDYEYIVTISEFHEFILPYLLLSDSMSASPVEMPNFLLASALSLNMKSLKFNELIGDFLAGQSDVSKDYKILSHMSNDERFREIKNKFSKISESDEIDDKEAESYIKDAALLANEYTVKVKESVQKFFYKDQYNRKSEKIIKLEEEKSLLQRKIERLEKKLKRKNKYQNKYNSKKRKK